MRAHAVLATALFPAAALAAPCADSVFGWTTTISKSFSWFAGEAPLTEPFVDSSKSIYDILKGRDEFGMLMKFVDKHEEIKAMLTDRNREITFFAPTNDAIKRAHPEFITIPGSKGEIVRDTLYYHTIPEAIEYSRLGENMTLPTEFRAYDGTFGGHRRRIRVEGSTLPNKVTLNRYVKVTESDIKAKNGIIHKIDMPLFPQPDIMDVLYMFPHEFSTTTTALLKIDLQEHYEYNSRENSEGEKSHNDRKGKGAGSTTLFVPTNEAWQNLPKDLVIFLFSPYGERTLRQLMQFHTIPEAIVHSEWVKDDKSTHDVVVSDKHRHHKGLEFEWDYHFDTLTRQKLPVHAKKTKSLIPGANAYNVEFKVHGVEAMYFDNVAQNGAHHILDVVLCPKHKEGRGKAQNAEDWEDWQEWIFDWTKDQEKSD